MLDAVPRILAKLQEGQVETNRRIDATNERLEQTNERLDETNRQLGMTNESLRFLVRLSHGTLLRLERMDERFERMDERFERM